MKSSTKNVMKCLESDNIREVLEKMLTNVIDQSVALHTTEEKQERLEFKRT